MKTPFDAPRNFRKSDPPAPRPERRRAPRWNAHVPVFVYGHAEGEAPFHEEAYSTVVSDRGALLLMSRLVAPGARLFLTNKVTEMEQECRVARVRPGRGDGVEIAVEFTAPAEHFWRVTAPPQRAPAIPSAKLQNDRR
jgi:hypothetical protein